MAFDFKKEYKELYLPGKKPVIVEVPEMKFIMVQGNGNPNNSPAYQNAMNVLYGLSYSIKMSKRSGKQPEGYFDYVVPPLEGLWWEEGNSFDGYSVTDKEKFHWISMIRQPDFVTEEVFFENLSGLKRKKPELDYSKVSFDSITEGLCAQILHMGSYDGEAGSIQRMEIFIQEAGYVTDISEVGKGSIPRKEVAKNRLRLHHEIYLGDPRKTPPEKLKTVIRHPIKEKDVP